jgi:hypothetical protein
MYQSVHDFGNVIVCSNMALSSVKNMAGIEVTFVEPMKCIIILIVFYLYYTNKHRHKLHGIVRQGTPLNLAGCSPTLTTGKPHGILCFSPGCRRMAHSSVEHLRR